MHCYSAEAAAGAKTSNLSLGSSLFGMIPDQVSDGSTGNDACGHRRWLLYSKAYRMGVGSVNSAGAVCVLPDHSTADRDTSRFHGIVPEYFAYPFKGYVPYPLIYSKWSFSVPGTADFSAAYVSAVSDSKKINCSVVSRTDNFGDPTIVWTVNEAMYKYADKKIAVTVGNVKVNGQMKSYSYSFTVIDPYAH